MSQEKPSIAIVAFTLMVAKVTDSTKQILCLEFERG